MRASDGGIELDGIAVRRERLVVLLVVFEHATEHVLRPGIVGEQGGRGCRGRSRVLQIVVLHEHVGKPQLCLTKLRVDGNHRAVLLRRRVESPLLVLQRGQRQEQRLVIRIGGSRRVQVLECLGLVAGRKVGTTAQRVEVLASRIG